MQQLEVNAERQDPPNSGEMPARLGFLVRRFHAQVERQRRADAELEAALERLARRGVIRKIFQEVKP
jgi:hypothetical protein